MKMPTKTTETRTTILLIRQSPVQSMSDIWKETEEEERRRRKKNNYLLFLRLHCASVCLCPLLITDDESSVVHWSRSIRSIEQLLHHRRRLLVCCPKNEDEDDDEAEEEEEEEENHHTDWQSIEREKELCVFIPRREGEEDEEGEEGEGEEEERRQFLFSSGFKRPKKAAEGEKMPRLTTTMNVTSEDQVFSSFMSPSCWQHERFLLALDNLLMLKLVPIFVLSLLSLYRSIGLVYHRWGFSEVRACSTTAACCCQLIMIEGSEEKKERRNTKHRKRKGSMSDEKTAPFVKQKEKKTLSKIDTKKNKAMIVIDGRKRLL